MGGPLLDEHGRLRATGWAPTPEWSYDPRAAGRRLRRKEWDFYGVTTRDHYVAIVVAHAGFLGLAAAQWIDLAARRVVVERASITPLGLGVAIGNRSSAGETRYGFRSARVTFTAAADGARRIHARLGDLSLDLALAPAQGVAIAAPLGGGRGFYYNHKIPAIPARGTIALGARTVALDDAFATLDWGRGVWPYRTSWRWAVAQGRLADGRTIGLTLGDVSADAGAPREDALIIDGVLHKLGPVAIDFDRADPMRPWRLRGDGVDLTLAPRVDNSRTVNLGAISSRLAQAIGTITGTVALGAADAAAPGGSLTRGAAGAIALPAGGVPGWAEEHLARW